MDRFICHCDALGDVEPATIVKGLKKKFPELGNVSQTPLGIRGSLICTQMSNGALAFTQNGDDTFSV